jgi:hypothetical protein
MCKKVGVNKDEVVFFFPPVVIVAMKCLFANNTVGCCGANIFF